MTPNQRETLTHMEDYYRAHGVAPSFRQLADMAGVSSITSIHRRIQALVEAGFVTKTPGRSRSYIPAKANLSAVSTEELLGELERRRALRG